MSALRVVKMVAAPRTPSKRNRSRPRRRKPLRLSVVVTAYNEGPELRRTIESIRQSTRSELEVLLVDDGSTDGSLSALSRRGLQIIRHAQRTGVAYSRDEACAKARGTVLAILDGHQRIEDGALDLCAEAAVRRSAIVCPDLCGFDNDERIHGAFFVLSNRQGCFTAQWKFRLPSGPLVSVSSLRAPAYVIPRTIYPKVRWSSLLRGWGGSEAAISLKAFFAGVDILHLCGPLVRHQFKTAFHYDVGLAEIWRNHAIIARICFEERTWHEYWLPQVFEPHLTDEARRDLESDAILAEQEEFARIKVRPDRAFWTELVFQPLPSVLS